MSMLSVARQARPEITLAVCRGACRLMRQAGHSVLLELPGIGHIPHIQDPGQFKQILLTFIK